MKVVKNSILYVAISGVFLLISLFLLIFGKLNLGIDMTWGIQMDFDHQAELNIAEIKDEVQNEAKEFKHNSEEVINDTSVYRVTGEKTVSVVVVSVVFSATTCFVSFNSCEVSVTGLAVFSKLASEVTAVL